MNHSFDPEASTRVLALDLDLSATLRILLVDDDALMLEHLRTLVEAAGFNVATAANGPAALASLKDSFASIVIMDRGMPNMDGLALCREIRRRSWPGYVYILLLTAQDAEQDILAGLDAGADDYLGKRASSAQLLARLRTARRILALEHSLRQALEEKRRLSLTDPLTGAANRRYFLKQLEQELGRVQRSGGALSLLALDIDHFKRINDRYGHGAGDAVLQEFVERVTRCLRRSADWCARIGGEEFVVVLGNTAGAGADHMAESIRAAVADSPIQTAAADISVTVSIGLSEWTPALSALPTVGQMLQRTDEALYASKTRGRNCVTRADWLRPG